MVPLFFCLLESTNFACISYINLFDIEIFFNCSRFSLRPTTTTTTKSRTASLLIIAKVSTSYQNASKWRKNS